MIFNWISRCWGGMGITTQFEKARINCTIADWTVPFQTDILILLTSFQDKNPQIPAKTAVNIFLSHLQTDQQKAHPAFLLKHLYILDHCIEEMTALDVIGYYYNSNLTATKSHKSIDVNDNRSPLRQLINSYYAYLITKARIFGQYERTYFSKQAKPISMKSIQSSAHNIQTKTYNDEILPSQVSLPNGSQFDFMCSSGRKRKQKECTQQQKIIHQLFEKQSSYNSIFDIVEKCQQIQKLINEINKAYQTGNKKAELIKYIFIMCLWTYIRCYIIVSVGVKFLFKHFLSMSLKELERFIKTFQYFNNEYTADFIRFVESNKNEIDIFKEINYNQLTYVNKDGMRVLLDYKEELKSKEAMKVPNSTRKLIDLPSTKSISGQNTFNSPVYPTIFDELQNVKIMELPLQVHTRIKENMKIFYKPRKNMDFCLVENPNKIISQPYVYEDYFEEIQMQDYFFNHQNFYHQQFAVQTTEQLPLDMKSNQSQPSNNQLKAASSSLVMANKKENTPEFKKTRKLSIDMDIERLKTQEKKVDKEGIDQNVKLTTQKILEANSKNRSIEPIKASQMNEIKEMFRQKRKGSRKYSAWETWENVYGQNTDSLAIKN